MPTTRSTKQMLVVLETLAEQGASAELIIATMKKLLVADEEDAAERRAADRKRKQAYRDKKRSVSRDVPRDKSDTPSSLPQTPNPTPPISPSPLEADGLGAVDQAFASYVELADRVGLDEPPPLSSFQRKRLSQTVRSIGIEKWREALKRVESSDFCCGRTAKEWKADLTFLLKPGNVEGLLAGKYETWKPPERRGAGKAKPKQTTTEFCMSMAKELEKYDAI